MDGPFLRSSSVTSVLASVLEATKPSRDLSPTLAIVLIGGVSLLATGGVGWLFVELQSAVDEKAAPDADPVITASVKPTLPRVRKIATTSVRVAIRRAAPAMAGEAGPGEDRGTLEPHDPEPHDPCWAPARNERSAIDFASTMHLHASAVGNETNATNAADLVDAKEAAADTPPNVKQSTRTIRVNHGVNMRSRPESGSRVLTVVPKSASVELVGCKLWCEVFYKGRRGYLFKDFVQGKAPTPVKQEPATEPVTGIQDAFDVQPVGAAGPVAAKVRQSDLAANDLGSSPRRHP